MAGDVTYADVAMLPRERPHIPSRTPAPGNTITYAELRVKPKPKRNSRPETSSSGCRHRCSAWFYVALVLGVLVFILLAIIAIQAQQSSKGRAGKSGSLSQYGVNSTSNPISTEKTISAVPLKWLMEELCEDGQEIPYIVHPPLVLENTFQTAIVHKQGEEFSFSVHLQGPGTTCELCPPGWQLHRGRCYYFSEETRSWDDSQKKCLARKSQLLVIDDGIEMEFIDNKEKDPKYIWIGSETQDTKKLWSSVEGHGVKVNSRTARETTETDKSCPVYRRKNTIQHDNCQTLKKWICKKNATLLVL